MQDLNVTFIQSTLFWESPAKNREMFTKKIASIKEKTGLIVLPEMFSTGFSMFPKPIAEDVKGDSFMWMQQMAKDKNAAIAGSIATKENNKYYNRFYWVEPDGKYYQYDKKHLFKPAGEDKEYAAGNKKTIINYKGWNFLPLICYDLRFPVWSKNNFSEENGYDYDCIIYVANWPKARNHQWKILLMARAIENQSYLVGVNRIGEDDNNNIYSGDSAVINPKGDVVSSGFSENEVTETVALSYEKLKSFRENFKLGQDWDKFEIL